MSRKRKHVKGQRTLSGTLTDSSESSSSGFTTAVKRRGTLSTWRDFGEAKWKTQFPWLEIRSDGVYCHYCQTGTTRGASRSGSEVHHKSKLTLNG